MVGVLIRMEDEGVSEKKKEINEERYDFILKMVLATFVGSGLLYGMMLLFSLIVKKTISFGESLTYFGSVLAACVTVFGVMWQIEKNNQKIDGERIVGENIEREKRIKREKDVQAYITYILDRNVSKFEIGNGKTNLNQLMDYFIERKFNHVERKCKWFYAIENEYIYQNLQTIQNLEYANDILKLFSEIEKFNKVTNELMYTFDIFETKKIYNISEVNKREECKNNWFKFLISSELDLIMRTIFTKKNIPSVYNNHDGLEGIAIQALKELKINEEIINEYKELRNFRQNKESRVIIYEKSLVFLINIFYEMKAYLDYDKLDLVNLEKTIHNLETELNNFYYVNENVFSLINKIYEVKEQVSKQ